MVWLAGGYGWASGVGIPVGRLAGGAGCLTFG